jgi:hypothetical protein
MHGTNISYSVIGEAMAVDEQLQWRQNARMRYLYVGEEFEYEEEDLEEDEDFMTEDWDGLDVLFAYLQRCNMYLLILKLKLWTFKLCSPILLQATTRL